jgi:ribosomal protein S12 methylthiotransferase
VLRAMHRRVTRKQTEDVLNRLRRRIPGVTIRTTFIVGFPGETEAEFDELLDFVRSSGFDAVGAFRYSLEPDTPAGRMKCQLDEEVKQERYERLMLAQQEVAFAAAKRRIGETFEVVVDGAARRDTGDSGVPHRIARHAGQAPEVDAVCLLSRSGSKGSRVESGQFVAVRCMGTDGYDLLVEPVAVKARRR